MSAITGSTALPAVVVALVAFAGLASACQLPVTSQTMTGGAINAGTMFFVDQLNDDSYAGEGYYDYRARLSADTLAAVFLASVREANRDHLFPRSLRADAGTGADRPDFPARHWTPAPLFSLESETPAASGDSLAWIVTHRAESQVTVVLVRRGPGTASLTIAPHDPSGGLMLTVPRDHAQRNAVEVLREKLFLAVAERFGDDALIDAGRRP